MKAFILIFLLIFSSTVNGTSVRCRPGSSYSYLSEGALVEIDSDLSAKLIKITVPKKLNGHDYVHSQIVVGSEDDPRLVFFLKTNDVEDGEVGQFTVYKHAGPIFISVVYGGQCDGASLWQRIAA